MNEEHMKMVFDSFISLIKPFTKDCETITLTFVGAPVDDLFSAAFDNGKTRVGFNKTYYKDLDEWKEGVIDGTSDRNNG